MITADFCNCEKGNLLKIPGTLLGIRPGAGGFPLSNSNSSREEPRLGAGLGKREFDQTKPRAREVSQAKWSRQI